MKDYSELKAMNKTVDMTRGRPAKEQLEIAMPMLEAAGKLDYRCGAQDARNYGDLKGVPAARRLFADIFGGDEKNVVALDGSSLSIMYELICCAMHFGIMGSKAWRDREVKFLCPAPGYDRHFAICEAFGIKMIPIKMLECGPDMDEIERLVSADESVKGVWCVPKYSNPTGVVFSDEVVERFAALNPKAEDFRIFWDNAYIVHALYDEDIPLKNLYNLLEERGKQDMIYEIASTSKITFAGSGVAALRMSEGNIEDFLRHLKVRLINPNKVNQVMHANFLKDAAGVREIMKKHAAILRPKFELVNEMLQDAFKGEERVSFSKPKGGYFVSFNVQGKAKEVVQLASRAGVHFTAAGSTYPYFFDPNDANIRIAPSVPDMDELEFAMQTLIASVRMALK